MTVPRPTRVEIDLAALRHNFREARRTAGSGCDVLAVVKADAYGHGVGRVAPALADEGAQLFGVALVEEGLELRRLGIDQPILILGGVFPGQEVDVVEHRLTPVLYDLATARRLDQTAGDIRGPASYHLKVDTGMGRLGFRAERLEEVLTELRDMSNLEMTGLMSHLAVADEPQRPLTGRQHAVFTDVIARVEAGGFCPRYRHIANSAGIFGHDLPGCNLVRPGISLYGGLTGGPFSHSFLQKPVMRFTSQVAQVKEVPPGEGISYGHRFITTRHSRIAAVPVGYADGYNRLLTNRGEVLIRGRRATVAGTVCMDWTLVDVTELPDVQVGDQVTLLGRDGDQSITAEEWADKVGSITYEVFCNISKRVPRIFLDN